MFCICDIAVGTKTSFATQTGKEKKLRVVVSKILLKVSINGTRTFTISFGWTTSPENTLPYISLKLISLAENICSS